MRLKKQPYQFLDQLKMSARKEEFYDTFKNKIKYFSVHERTKYLVYGTYNEKTLAALSVIT